ncbi:Uncharacterized protein LSUE1_G010204, partial [Lachnellula suecica]
RAISLLPAAILETIIKELLQRPDAAIKALLYGLSAGYNGLRYKVSQWLTENYKPRDRITPDRILISCGASHNLASILQMFSDPLYTRGIWMIEPTYFLACDIFANAGFQGRLHGVPEDDEGVDVEFLRSALRKEDRGHHGSEHRVKKGNKFYKHFIYCVPTFSNPSSKTMSLSRRKKLVEIAREFDALVVTDDCYDFLRWPEDNSIEQTELGPCPPRLVDIDRSMEGCSKFGNTVSNGTFSKLIGPGVRVGWAEGTSSFVGALAAAGANQSGGNPSQLSSSFAHRLLERGVLQQHIATVLIPAYRRRYSILMGSIRRHLVPLGVKVLSGAPYRTPSKTESNGEDHVEVGGFFTYITFPHDLPTADVLADEASARFSVHFAYGKMFEVEGDNESGVRKGNDFRHAARLCWAWESENFLAEGPERLAELILSLRNDEC